MPWFKIDDGFWSHEKVIELSPDAGWLWTRAGSYCAHQLTDGVVKKPVLSLLGAPPGAADELVAAGLWDKVSGGFQFHDWVQYQPTRGEVESKREAWRERQRKARESRRDTPSESHVESTSPVPSRPVPSPSSTKKSGVRRKAEVALPADWQPNASHVQLARERGVDGRHEEAQFRAHAAANDRRQRDWDAAFRLWLGRARPSGGGSTVGGGPRKPTPGDRAAATLALADGLKGIGS